MNRLLKKMGWKHASGRWNLDEIKYDFIGFGLIAIAIASYVWLTHG